VSPSKVAKIRHAYGICAETRHPDHPAFSIHPDNKAKLAGDRDGSYLGVIVRNYLPCVRQLITFGTRVDLTSVKDFEVGEVTVDLHGRDGEKHRFTTPVDTLQPGKNRLTLFCPVRVIFIRRIAVG
jgi:hypothetical protein